MSVMNRGIITTKTDVDTFCSGYFIDSRKMHGVVLEVFVHMRDFMIYPTTSGRLEDVEVTLLTIHDIDVVVHFLEKMQGISKSDNVHELTVRHQMLAKTGVQFLFSGCNTSRATTKKVEKAIRGLTHGCFGNVSAGEVIPTHNCDFSALIAQAKAIRSVVTTQEPPSTDGSSRTRVSRVLRALRSPRGAYHRLRTNANQ